jgi:hypothetical protein
LQAPHPENGMTGASVPVISIAQVVLKVKDFKKELQQKTGHQMVPGAPAADWPRRD